MTLKLVGTSPLSHDQKYTLQTLNSYILNPAILVKGCPLDCGRHPHKSPAGLANLGGLPPEIWHQILGHVDVKTLVGFRRVNRRAMDAVDGMLEWQKIITHAPNTIRMALAIRTAHTFTLKALLEKLCQRTCDGDGCSKLAPYVDVFTLSRRCLSVGGLCENVVGPRSYVDLYMHASESLPAPARLSTIPSFRAIPGTYGTWNRLIIYPNKLQATLNGRTIPCALPESSEDIFTHYSPAAVQAFTGTHYLASRGIVGPGSGLDRAFKLSAVAAPWVDSRGPGAEHGVFCPVCLFKASYEWNKHNPLQVNSGAMVGAFHDRASPIQTYFGSVEDVAEHVEREHP